MRHAEPADQPAPAAATDQPAAATGPGDRLRLARCVRVPVDEFAVRYFGRRPLLSRSPELAAAAGRAGVEVPPGFDDLLGVTDVDELLSRRGLRTPFLRVAREGRLVPATAYTGGGGAGAEITDQVLDERIVGLLAGGATLVLQGLHRLWPPLVDFAVGLRTDLGHPVQINAYLTPAGNQGFASHYDTHDVFVLQVAGCKRWRIHPPVLVDPLERQPWGGRAGEVAATARGEPVIDTLLRPGDALYLPRGWLHSAAAQQSRSLHLTVGIRTVTRYDLLHALLGAAVEEPALRVGLPLGADPSDPQALAPHLADTVRTLTRWLGRVPPERVAELLRRRAWPATRPAPVRPLAQVEAAATLTPDDRVAVRPGLRWRFEARGADRIGLAAFDRTVELPAWCEPALRALLAGAPVRVGDLPGIAVDDAVVLVRRLLRESIVIPLDTRQRTPGS